MKFPLRLLGKSGFLQCELIFPNCFMATRREESVFSCRTRCKHHSAAQKLLLRSILVFLRLPVLFRKACQLTMPGQSCSRLASAALGDVCRTVMVCSTQTWTVTPHSPCDLKNSNQFLIIYFNKSVHNLFLLLWGCMRLLLLLAHLDSRWPQMEL